LLDFVGQVFGDGRMANNVVHMIVTASIPDTRFQSWYQLAIIVSVGQWCTQVGPIAKLVKVCVRATMTCVAVRHMVGEFSGVGFCHFDAGLLLMRGSCPSAALSWLQ